MNERERYNEAQSKRVIDERNAIDRICGDSRNKRTFYDQEINGAEMAFFTFKH